MACTKPLDGWRAAKRSESGKHPVVFNIKEANTDQPIQVPCGKCIGCSTERSATWSTRMTHEASQHQQNSFLTLTYADPCPQSINKRDLQRFFKRLRNHAKFRYFAVGEYGERTHRPHYHAIIFGQDFRGGAYQLNDDLYCNDIVTAAWGHGMTSIGEVTPASCAYVAGYVNKKAGDPDTFNLMSRRPGIGHTWLDKYTDDIARTKTITIEGREVAIPKKYLEWKQHELQHILDERAEYFRTQELDQPFIRRTKLRGQELNIRARTNMKQETL